MKKVSVLTSLVAFLVLALSASALAQSGRRVYTLSTPDPASDKFKARPGVFDPDHTGAVDAQWISQIGLADDRGGGNFGLYLQKFDLTSANSAAGAVIDKVQGITLTQLGFDYRTDSTCTGGSPRFNVVATDGFHFIGGCGNGTITPGPAAGWNRVTFDPQNPTQAYPVITPGATIISITLIHDEGTDTGPGFAVLDNINVNGQYITKPGAAK